MTVPQDDTTTDPHAVIAALRAERDAAVARGAKLDRDYVERAGHQAATVEVLQAMAASPGDAKPVFELIVRRAHDLCDAYTASLARVVDGSIVLGAYVVPDEGDAKGHEASFPRPVAADTMFGRAILAREPVQLPDVAADQTYALREGTLRGAVRAQAAVPLMRDRDAVGAINITRRQTGEFSQAQIELLQVFAAQAVIAITSAETYGALKERTAALAQRNTEYGERIEHQSATIDVLKAMSASPGDPQPVFDLIVERARDLCDAYGATVFEFDGTGIHWRAATGVSDDPAVRAAYEARFPMVPTRGWAFGRAILDRRIIRIDDMEAEPGLDPTLRGITAKSNVTTPIMRGDEVIGAIGMGSREKGGFSDSQVELLKTFAEQAAIAITSAETYRALQTRTSDLQETLEYQTATSDVLKVISRSTFDLQPVLDTVAETAARLCVADQAVIIRSEGEFWRFAANFGFPPEYETYLKALGPMKPDPASPTIAHRTATEGRPVHIDDVAAVPGYPEALIKLGKQRTALGVPLLRSGETIGLIQLSRQRVQPFTDRQIALVRTFADQAVIAIENTRLINEQQEALEQQTATAEVLQVINASPGNLTPVFDSMLEKAMHLCGAAFGELYTLDGDDFRPVALMGIPAALAAYRRSAPPPAPAGSIVQRIREGANIVHTADAKDADLYRSGEPTRRALVDLGGARSVLTVALRKDEALLGFISIYRQEVRLFTDRQIALLENFAAQAVIAIENARLITEQREALEQQTATAEVLQVINSSPGNLAPVFAAILDKAHSLCGIDLGELELNEDGKFHAVAMRGVSGSLAELLRQPFTPPPDSPLARLLAGEPVVQIADLSELAQQRPDDRRAQAGAQYGLRTVLFVPLRQDEVLLGYITAYRKEVRPFSKKEIALLQNFAAQAVIAMENTRLITEQREALERQTATAEVLQVINANPGNLTPVFDAILEKAHSLCGAVIGSLLVYDGEHFRSIAGHGHPERVAAFLATPFRPNAFLQRLVDGEHIVHVADFAAAVVDPKHGLTRGTIENTQVRTSLWVPLRKDGTLLGCISAFREEVRVFSDKEIALLENFAAQAVIAMDNARLIDEQREALEQQTATAEVLQVINASPGNLAPVLDAMLEKATRLCDGAQGTLWMFDGERMCASATAGYSSELAEQLSEWREIHPFQRRLSQGERVFQIVDLAAEELYHSGNPLTRAAVDVAGIRTVVFVALVKDATTLGGFTIGRREVRAFTDKHIALLQNFAEQAVIAMENARLITEQREALEQQTATAEVLQVINASPGNLAPVFDAMLEKAMRLCEAHFGLLIIREGEAVRVVGSRNVPSDFTQYLTREPPRVDQETFFGRAMSGRAIVHVADATVAQPYRDGRPLAVAAVELGGIRSMLMVPLLKDDVALGLFTVYRQEVRAFSDKQIALLENFAAQAVVAMENARLMTEQREALEQQTATAEVLQVINASPGNLAPVFDAMLEKAMRLCDATYGHFRTYDGEGFPLAAVCGDPGLVELHRQRMRHFVPGPHNPISRFRQGESLIHISDAAASEAYRGDPGWQELVDTGACRSVLAVALRKDTVLLGYISVYRREVRPFSDKQITLLQTFAAQAVIAMENARLLDEIRQRQDELRITFENMGDGVAMFNETQHLVAWNSKFQEIFDLPDVLLEQQRTYEEHLRFLAARGDFGAGVDTTEQIHDLVATTGQPYGYERTRPDGRVIEIRRNPVPDGGFVLIFSDITERKRSETEIRAARDAAEEASRTIEAAYRELKAAQANLVQAEKMASLGQLTAGIAHEIKNPLNFVNNFAALSVDLLSELKETAAPGFATLTEKQRAEIEDVSAMLTSNLEKITEHGKRADGIVKAMLEHSRGSSGERRMVDLNALIDEALNLAYHGARAQDQGFNITLERDFGEGIAPIEVNPQDMTRVFLNIVSNGFYAATRRARNGGDAGFVPTLKVATRDAGDAVEIRVRDNGTGIPPEITDKLFQPFFTTKPTGEGTGLGLSITYDIVTKQHGGSIAVDSKVGEYSEFTIRLPCNP